MDKHGAFVIGVSDCGQEVCAASGRISTQSGTALEIFDRSHDEDKNTKLIGKVTRSGHTSTTEHIFFNLAFENVSVVVEQFMIEFRLASFTVKSRRYVDFSSCGYYIPDCLSDSDRDDYVAIMDRLFATYTKFCDSGIPKEDARFLLPYCFYSNFYCSLGGRELINVLKAMLYGRGKDVKEIYEIGLSLLEQCRKLAPGLFIDFEEKASKYNDTIALDFDVSPIKAADDTLCEILSHTESGEALVAKSALLEAGYTLHDADAIISDEGNRRKIFEALTHCDRARALESFNVTIKFSDVSLACLTHFARHRMQSLLIPDIIKAERDNFVFPDSISANPEVAGEYIRCFAEMAEFFCKMKEKGYGKDVLIYCVLSGNTLDIVSTMNGRELMLFLNLRSCTRAQWEIQKYAVELLGKLREIAPSLFSFYGPSCYVKGYCPEGKMTCGRASEMKEKFKSM